MDRINKKQLKEKFKQMKPAMGVFFIQNKLNNKYYLEATTDLKSTMNSAKFKLSLGRHPNRELQRDWSDHGETVFLMDILDQLDYDKNDPEKDYADDLNTLLLIWKDKLTEDKAVFYNK